MLTAVNMLNRDLSFMFSYFKYNKLIINLNKDKTYVIWNCETPTAKHKQLELYYDQTKVNVTKTYTYLGSTLGPRLD